MGITLTEAQARGWHVAGTQAWAPGANATETPTVEVHTDADPLPALLANIAEREGVGDTPGYGAPTVATPLPAAGADMAAAVAAGVMAALPNADPKAIEAAVLASLEPNPPTVEGVTP